MKKEAFLLEIGCEEIPARFMPGTLKLLAQEAEKIFASYRLSWEDIKTLGTPRRLVLSVQGLAGRQLDLEEKKKGPARKVAFDEHNKPTRAAIGFARGQGVRVEDLIVENMEGTDYVFALTQVVGEDTEKILPTLLPELIHKITFPRPMFWESRDIRFARPIRWLLALYGKNGVSFDYGSVKSALQTYGHRFLSPGPHSVASFEDYFATLKNNYVVVDPEERKQIIVRAARDVAGSLNGEVLMDEELLSEVNFLVEYPLPLAGSFSEDYLNLPREVLITTMQSHQRYFPVEDRGGKLMPHFITVANGTEHFQEKVRAGNERVLRARLSDAAFFYREDIKTPLKEKVVELKSIVFQEELGTLWDKTMRVVDLTRQLSNYFHLSQDDTETALRAAFLSKADLVSSLVYEFTELQGIMGREYALKSGEQEEVATAIYEHYLPRFAGDMIPETPAGSVVALSDKLDNILSSFALGKEPTGSQDPYALRRQALGVIAILAARKTTLDVAGFLEEAYQRLEKDARESLQEREKTVTRVMDFILQRLRFVLLEEGLRYDVVDALISSQDKDIYLISKRAGELNEMVESGALLGLLQVYTRVVNLASKAVPGVMVRPALFMEKEEQELYSAFSEYTHEGEKLLAQGDFSGFLQAGADLRPYVDNFFEGVMVMVKEDDVRLNRLALLKEIRDFFHHRVDLSKIVYT